MNTEIKIKRFDSKSVIPTYRQLIAGVENTGDSPKYRRPGRRCTPVFLLPEGPDGSLSTFRLGDLSADYKYQLVDMIDKTPRRDVPMNFPVEHFAGWMTEDGQHIKPGTDSKPSTMTAKEAFHWNFSHTALVKYRGDPEECACAGILMLDFSTGIKGGYLFYPLGSTGKAYHINPGSQVDLIGTIEVDDD